MRSPLTSALSLGLVGLLLFSSAGCKTYNFEITMRADRDGMDRELTCWCFENNKIQEYPASELQEIADAYGAKRPAKLDEKHTFKTRVAKNMPGGMSNSGTYTRWTCPLGDVCLYMERFGGNDDLAQQIESREKATNRLVDMLIEWLETELGKEPKWSELRHELDTTVRRDALNLSYLILSLASLSASMEPIASQGPTYSSGAANLMRFLQYIAEHGYVTPSEIPELVRNNGKGAMAWANRYLGRKLGLANDAPRPASMSFLQNEETFEASVNRYLITTPEYQELLNEWEKEKVDTPELQKPGPFDATSKHIQLATFGAEFLSDTKKLTVRLQCPKPFSANGLWDEETKQVVWKTNINGQVGLPTFLTAIWNEPNVSKQEKHFGRVVLVDDDNLLQYLMGYDALSDEDRTEWDTFIEGLSPGPNLYLQIRNFRFKGDAPADESSRANGLISLLLDGLRKGSPEEHPET